MSKLKNKYEWKILYKKSIFYISFKNQTIKFIIYLEIKAWPNHAEINL